MKIECKFYSDAIKRMEKEEKAIDPKELRAAILALQKRAEQQVRILNMSKRMWFEELARSALEFAGLCELDVLVQITDTLRGIIQFETCYFELSSLAPPETRAFWIYLSSTATTVSICLCPETFRIEYSFDLFEE